MNFENLKKRLITLTSYKKQEDFFTDLNQDNFETFLNNMIDENIDEINTEILLITHGECKNSDEYFISLKKSKTHIPSHRYILLTLENNLLLSILKEINNLK